MRCSEKESIHTAPSRKEESLAVQARVMLKTGAGTDKAADALVSRTYKSGGRLGALSKFKNRDKFTSKN